MALAEQGLDAASFTAVRLVSGALTLALIFLLRRWLRPTKSRARSMARWGPSLALLIYAAAFSFAYLTLDAGTGALILFAAVQITMLLAGMLQGDRLAWWQSLGLVGAFSGLAYLLSPGLAAPSLTGSVLMLLSGVAWGFYSLWGRSVADPVAATASNFLCAAPLAVVLAIVLWGDQNLTVAGVGLAVISGAVTSGLGYVVWYAALPGLANTQAATVQLLVPVIAALGGVFFLHEVLSTRLVVASSVILGGVALTLQQRAT